MKTKRFIFISAPLIFNSAFLVSYAQSPNWQWARNAAGIPGYSDAASANCTDASGNILVTGFFYSPTITFGSIVLTNTSINGLADIFVAKYGPSGNVLWAKSAGGIWEEEAFGISTDADNNVLVTGHFTSTSFTIGNTTLTNVTGGNSMFVTKLDSSGNVLWAKQSVGTDTDRGVSVATDMHGNVLVTGYFESPGITFGTVVLTNASAYSDIFIVKYNAAGSVLWAKREGGAQGESGKDISCDTNGNIVVGGNFAGQSFSIGGNLLSNTGSPTTRDVFFAKYDSSGNVLWAKCAGGIYNDFTWGIRTDATNNILLTGFFESPSITFSGIPLINTCGTCVHDDIFIVKYNASGNFLWAKAAGGSSTDRSYSIGTDLNGNSYLSGALASPSIAFGSMVLTVPPNCPGPACDPMFIVKYDSNGDAVCAETFFSGGGWAYGNAICADHFGNAFISGSFQTNPYIIGNDTLSLSASATVFTAKFTCGATGVNETAGSSNHLEVFPNPFSNQLKIITGLVKQKAELEVYDVFGRTIYFQKFLTGNSMLNTGNWQKGIYLLKLNTGVEEIVKKIVKE